MLVEEVWCFSPEKLEIIFCRFEFLYQTTLQVSKILLLCVRYPRFPPNQHNKPASSSCWRITLLLCCPPAHTEAFCPAGGWAPSHPIPARGRSLDGEVSVHILPAGRWAGCCWRGLHLSLCALSVHVRYSGKRGVHSVPCFRWRSWGRGSSSNLPLHPLLASATRAAVGAGQATKRNAR